MRKGRFSEEQITKMLPTGMPSERDRTGNEEIRGIALKDFVAKVHEFDKPFQKTSKA